jgi:uncharacterized protein YfdQ (DUF2303 family)
MNAPEIKTKTEAEVVAALAQHALQPVMLNSPDFKVPVLFNPKTGQLDALERFMPHPVRKRANVALRDHQSFIDYVAKHKEAGTQLFALVTEAGGSFTAIIDYHQAAEIGEARFGEHVVTYTAEHTPEWKRWLAGSGKSQGQVELALFIEDNRYDIVNPDGASMLELIKSFEATAGSDFKSSVRLENGDRAIKYTHTTTAKAGVNGDLLIPDSFFLKLPVFNNGPGYDVEARFRYKIDSGQLRVGYEIVRPHKVIELALTEARTAIQSTLGLTILLGTGSVTSR